MRSQHDVILLFVCDLFAGNPWNYVSTGTLVMLFAWYLFVVCFVICLLLLFVVV